jgi:hypothetical protein
MGRDGEIRITKPLWEMADVVEVLEAWENSRH